ncbi:PREDICTED: tumor necrosis factor receptor superfamily member 10A [Hipposideros armiger]|uniref:Tumor necrosis factor receptor superfamily member 10A n=1 Tax=Hipposideros armiger TaxID=186990 RepID=A0A8B7PZ50_HIPAR|nr:PREDICTED: tumor necrosis factor receptor superfamily member 10A [Hipposideros armiger]
MTTLPGPGALPDGTGQRGHSAWAPSGARALRSPAPVPARGARLRLWGPRAQIFVFALLMWVLNASAVTTGQDRVHSQPAAPQGWKQGLSDKLCPPGFFLSEYSGDCAPCIWGKEFTNHSNNLPSCQFCSDCGPGEEEKSPCTRTKDRECQCKPRTFLGKNSPEFCQPCSTRCPDGMVVAANCTPWSDLECVAQKSRNETNGEAAVPGEPATCPGPHNAPSPSSGSSQLLIGIVLGAVYVPLLIITCAYYHRRRICQGCGVVTECTNRVIFRCLCPPRGPEGVDNARNEIVSSTGSLSTQASEQELGHQEHAELKDVFIQSPADAERLAFWNPGLLLVQDCGAGLKLFFDYFTSIVIFNSWSVLKRLMASMTIICVARAQVSNPREALYEMLVTWLNNKGRAASVNTFLDALETLRERHTKELIQDHLVGSGKYVYKEDGAGSALS